MSKIEIKADVPDGWVGVEYRPPKKGEWYLRQGGTCLADFNYSEPWLILRRVEPKKESRWVNAYPCNDINPKAQFHETLQGAIAAQGDRWPMKVARFNYENGHPVSVALESVEGKG